MQGPLGSPLSAPSPHLQPHPSDPGSHSPRHPSSRGQAALCSGCQETVGELGTCPRGDTAGVRRRQEPFGPEARRPAAPRSPLTRWVTSGKSLHCSGPCSLVCNLG